MICFGQICSDLYEYDISLQYLINANQTNSEVTDPTAAVSVFEDCCNPKSEGLKKDHMLSIVTRWKQLRSPRPSSVRQFMASTFSTFWDRMRGSSLESTASRIWDWMRGNSLEEPEEVCAHHKSTLAVFHDRLLHSSSLSKAHLSYKTRIAYWRALEAYRLRRSLPIPTEYQRATDLLLEMWGKDKRGITAFFQSADHIEALRHLLLPPNPQNPDALSIN